MMNNTELLRLETLKQRISINQDENLLKLKVNILDKIENGMKTLDDKLTNENVNEVKKILDDFEDLINSEEEVKRIREMKGK